MYSIIHLWVLGSLVLGSDIFFNVLYFYIFSVASIHDIQRAN